MANRDCRNIISLPPESDLARQLRRIRVLHDGHYYDVDELTLDWLLSGKTPNDLSLQPVASATTDLDSSPGGNGP